MTQFLLKCRHRNNWTLPLYYLQVVHGSKDQTWSVRRLENWFEILDNRLSKRRLGSSVYVFMQVLMTSLRDWSSMRIWRHVANSIQPLCERSEDSTMVLLRTTWIPVFEIMSSLGFKTSRKLVLRALKIRLQNDGFVKVLKSSYTSWRPVFETGLQDGYEDVMLT